MSSSPKKGVLPQTFIPIRADNKVYRAYREGQNPGRLFQEATEHITGIQKKQPKPAAIRDLSDNLTQAIYGSNMIEHVGLNLANTTLLCKEIFSGLNPPPGPSPELYANQPEVKTWSPKDIAIAKSEVIQHAKAYLHLIQAFVVEGQDLTEELIKSTHRILTTDIPLRSSDGTWPDIPPSKYGGAYRTVVVGAGTTNFSVPKFIPKHMAQMCEDLKSDLATAENEGFIDPFSVAAKYSLQFVMIHPFQDGNGRMCRIILNAILCRFAGPGGIGMIPIGEEQEEREEYLGIKRRAGEEIEGHGEYATFVLERCVWLLRRLRQLTEAHSSRGIRVL